MEKNFHYYATYCAAYLAGYSHEECLDICYSAQFVDWCSKTYLARLRAPMEAATTQTQLELLDTDTGLLGLQNMTRIWSSFHFLPRDLNARREKCSDKYRDKYRLICGPNGKLLLYTVELAKDSSLQAVGIAMHVLADTWAHQYFAGTPSLVINNTNYYFYEILPDGERPVTFRHNLGKADDLEKGIFTNTVYQSSENSIMNLGHGRCGHLPDYSFMRYKYLPAWGDYEEVVKDNPSDYYHAFGQMVYALKYYRGEYPDFETDQYDWETLAPLEGEIKAILEKRQLDTCAEWKALGEKLSGKEIPDFDMDRYQEEYMKAGETERDETFLGKFILAALVHKSMVTNKIFRSGNLLAGVSVNYKIKGFKGMRDYMKLLKSARKKAKK